MGKLFDIRWGGEKKDGYLAKCCRLVRRNCNPLQVTCGFAFGTVGIGFTAAGFAMSEGIGFIAETVSQAPYQIPTADIDGAVDYVREAYRSSVERAIDAGTKQFPITYAIGHYVGGKIRDIPRLFGGKRDG
jgi:hypothetical protein